MNDEPRDIIFRGKPTTVYTWRRAMHYPDHWLAAASGTIWTEGGMLSEWKVDRVWLVDGRPDHFYMDAMRYW